MYEYQAWIERIVDGDTVDVLIDLGFDVHMKQRIRLDGIDTPETRTTDLTEKQCGKLAQKFVEDRLLLGNAYKLNTTLDNEGKFGRVLGVFTLESGEILGDLLMQNHLAAPYYGQSKTRIKEAHKANQLWLEAAGLIQFNQEG
jgi:micrococcal nuclease